MAVIKKIKQKIKISWSRFWCSKTPSNHVGLTGNDGLLLIVLSIDLKFTKVQRMPRHVIRQVCVASMPNTEFRKCMICQHGMVLIRWRRSIALHFSVFIPFHHIWYWYSRTKKEVEIQMNYGLDGECRMHKELCLAQPLDLYAS